MDELKCDKCESSTVEEFAKNVPGARDYECINCGNTWYEGEDIE